MTPPPFRLFFLFIVFYLFSFLQFSCSVSCHLFISVFCSFPLFLFLSSFIHLSCCPSFVLPLLTLNTVRLYFLFFLPSLFLTSSPGLLFPSLLLLYLLSYIFFVSLNFPFFARIPLLVIFLPSVVFLSFHLCPQPYPLSPVFPFIFSSPLFFLTFFLTHVKCSAIWERSALSFLPPSVSVTPLSFSSTHPPPSTSLSPFFHFVSVWRRIQAGQQLPGNRLHAHWLRLCFSFSLQLLHGVNCCYVLLVTHSVVSGGFGTQPFSIFRLNFCMGAAWWGNKWNCHITLLGGCREAHCCSLKHLSSL